MLQLIILAFASCQEAGKACAVQGDCCPHLICYEYTACIHADDVQLIKKLSKTLELTSF